MTGEVMQLRITVRIALPAFRLADYLDRAMGTGGDRCRDAANEETLERIARAVRPDKDGVGIETLRLLNNDFLGMAEQDGDG